MYNCGSISIGGGAAVHHVIISNGKIYDTAVASALLIATMLPLRITLCIIPAGTMYAGSGSAFLTHEA
jgi:hypothetical protein